MNRTIAQNYLILNKNKHNAEHSAFSGTVILVIKELLNTNNKNCKVKSITLPLKTTPATTPTNLEEKKLQFC